MGGIGFFVMLLLFLFTGQGQNFMNMMGEGSQMVPEASEVSNQGSIQAGTDEGREFIAVTAAALAVLMDPETGFPPLLKKAVKAAANRGRELGAE